MIDYKKRGKEDVTMFFMISIAANNKSVMGMDNHADGLTLSYSFIGEA